MVHSDGVIVESDLVLALQRLGEAVQRGASGGTDGVRVDVLNMSMGYYHETPADALFDPTMYDLLRALRECGTVVVTSAGNDATSGEQYPAAFTPHPGGFVTSPEPGCAPLLSVGANNPDGTVALFSNCGDWVTSWATGAAVVTTMPPFQGGYEPQARTVALGQERASLDPDSFVQGFGVWSGTSFSAPVVAGRVAQRLWTDSEACGDDTDASCLSVSIPAAAVARADRAVEQAGALAP